MDVARLEDFNFNNKRVLVRTDYNVPVDEEGNITDSKRIEDSLETIRYLLENGSAKIIIVTHIGRPKEHEEKLKTDNVAKKLSELIGMEVKKIDDWGENGLPEERIVILENARFNSKEKSKDEAERDEFAQIMCQRADLFVMEAFSNMHRGKQASMTSTMKFLPACMGRACQKEIETIQRAIDNPQRPFVSIIGGAKADKLGSVDNIMQNADKVLLGGALAFTVLHAKGFNMGKSKIDHENLENYNEVFEKIKDNDKIMLPEDAVVADEFSDSAESKTVPVDKVEDNWMALDLGEKTIEKYKKELMGAKTICWNGPLGVFEFEKFAIATKEIAQAISETDAFSIIGGGDSAAAINELGFSDKVSFVSSGGGASLMMFEGKELPVLKAMKENYSKFTA